MHTRGNHMLMPTFIARACPSHVSSLKLLGMTIHNKTLLQSTFTWDNAFNLYDNLLTWVPYANIPSDYQTLEQECTPKHLLASDSLALLSVSLCRSVWICHMQKSVSESSALCFSSASIVNGRYASVWSHTSEAWVVRWQLHGLLWGDIGAEASRTRMPQLLAVSCGKWLTCKLTVYAWQLVVHCRGDSLT